MTYLPFQKLQVWVKGMALAKKIYEVTRGFPEVEQYGLANQLRRAAVSVPSNIAEGSQKNSDKEFVRFLRIAKGSLAEIETQVVLARDFGYISEASFLPLSGNIQELSKMLWAFIDTMSSR